MREFIAIPLISALAVFISYVDLGTEKDLPPNYDATVFKIEQVSNSSEMIIIPASDAKSRIPEELLSQLNSIEEKEGV
ncbi:MAG: hypothetical protein GC137_09700 [Alphaproteobacteria bacterium]|nr:hypothetical protein [Alphaproteobacteria bacterium]